MPFVPVPAIEEIRAGRVLVVVDDEDRENEGDLTIAAEKVTPEIINFMATHGRGLICLALTAEHGDVGLATLPRRFHACQLCEEDARQSL